MLPRQNCNLIYKLIIQIPFSSACILLNSLSICRVTPCCLGYGACVVWELLSDGSGHLAPSLSLQKLPVGLRAVESSSWAALQVFQDLIGEKVSRGDQPAALGDLCIQTALQPLNWSVFLILLLLLLFSLRLTPVFIQPHSSDLQKTFSKASAILLWNFKNGLLNKWNN